jgi:ribonucleotide reductase beta subunit family protein with ferritin-like domain
VGTTFKKNLTAQLVSKFVHINLQVEILSLQYPQAAIHSYSYIHICQAAVTDKKNCWFEAVKGSSLKFSRIFFKFMAHTVNTTVFPQKQ